MIEALIVVFSVAGYSVVTGSVFSVFMTKDSWSDGSAILPAVVWPLVLPAMLGGYLVKRDWSRKPKKAKLPEVRVL